MALDGFAAQIARLDQRVTALERQNADQEVRLRTIESAYLRLAGKISLLSVVGSALATAAVQWLIKAGAL